MWKSSKRYQYITERWKHILALGVTGAAIVVGLFPWLMPWLRRYLLHPAGQTNAQLVVFACIGTFIVWTWYRNPGNAPGWLHVRYPMQYPPFWLASVFGIALVLIVYSWLGASVEHWGLEPVQDRADWTARAVCLAVILSGVVATVHVLFAIVPSSRVSGRQQRDDNTVAASMSFSNLTQEQRRQWLLSDAEIATRGQDYFGHSVIASRIARRIICSVEKPPTMVLLGETGSGKTSVANLVSEDLKSHRGADIVSFVRISAWPYDTPQALVQGILSRLTSDISRYVDTTGLREIDTDYLRLIEGFGGFWEKMASTLRRNRSPEELLQMIDKSCVCIGLRVVLWVEDLERFVYSDAVPEASVLETRAERLSAVRAVLHLLDRLESMCVIVASTSIGYGIDLEKMARYIDRLGRINAGTLLPLVRDFRLMCLATGEVDPASSSIRSRLDVSTDEEELNRRISFLDGLAYDLPTTLAILLSNPRRLKFSLRECLSTWDALAGELDFDDLLLMTAVKHGAPRTFRVITDNERHLRYRDWGSAEVVAGTGDRGSSNASSLFNASLDAAIRGDDVLTRRQTEELLNFVFPSWNSNNRDSSGSLYEKPQGIGGTPSHADYWNRFNSVPELEDVDRDQLAIADMLAWKSGEGVRNGGSEYVKRLCEPGRQLKAEAFVQLLEWDDLARLLREVAEYETGRSLDDWRQEDPDSLEPHGVVAVWRMMRMAVPATGQSAALTGDLVDLVRSLVPVNLAVAQALVRYYATARRQITDLLDQQLRERVRQAQLDSMRENFLGPDAPETLARSVRSGSPYVLRWSCWGSERLAAGNDVGQPFEWWSRLAASLVEAAESHPEDILPQIVTLITQERDHGVRVFNESAARDLFGGTFTRLADTMATHSEVVPGRLERFRRIPDEYANFLAACRDYAERLLTGAL